MDMIKDVLNHNLDLIKFLFIQFTFTVVFLGLLITFIEPYLPGKISLFQPKNP
jgi:hypothetical protein